MPISNYQLGIVVGLQGLNINQRLEIGKRLKFIAENLEPGGNIFLSVPRIYNAGAEDFLVHPDVAVLQYKERVVLQAFDVRMPTTAPWLLEQLRTCDEVWCCPGERQDTLLCKAVPNRLYRLAQEQAPAIARAFKMIPVWAELPEGETRVKRVKRHEPKLKKGKRK